MIAVDSNILVYAFWQDSPRLGRAREAGELWSADRDFSYLPALRTRNPLVGLRRGTRP